MRHMAAIANPAIFIDNNGLSKPLRSKQERKP